jgi:hypothetical protein
MLSSVASLSIAAVIGFVTWAYAPLFFRAVLYATGSREIALAATLSGFLIGLACGAEEASRNCMVLTRDGTMRRAMGALMKANLAGILFLPLVGHLAWLDHQVVGVAILLVFFAGRFWGALLPYLAELGMAADAVVGRRVAWLAGAHHIGAAVGAGSVGLALSAGLGLATTAAMLAAAGLGCAALAWSVLAVPRWEKMLRASLAGALGLAASAIILLGSGNALDHLRVVGGLDAEGR